MTSPKNLKEYRKYLTLQWAGGDLTGDEKRVQGEFHDKRIKVRWHYLDKTIQVWYETPRNPYCVLSYKPQDYSICKVIYELRGRQRTAKELKEDYFRNIAEFEKINQDKIQSISGEMARSVRKIARGRVTSSPAHKRR
jgi:hypothetical protein